MAQSRPTPTLHFSLTPMQLPEAATAIELAGSPQTTAFGGSTSQGGMTRCEILLNPGEPSEMVVQMENRGSRPVGVNLQLEGNFPSEWYRIGMEGHEIPPMQRMDAVIYFQVPADFFESPGWLGTGEAMKLDCQLRVYVHYIEQGTGRQLVDSAAFNLYVRPRSLYLDFLPALYREVDFIGRFLKIFEQTFEPAVQTMDVLWAYLDPMTAPQALLPFLAHWVAWPMDSRWSLNRQRSLIARAVELYRWRGTKRGLRLYLHFYTDLPLDDHLPEEMDKHIRIEEIFGRGFVLGETHLGTESIIGGGRPYHFIVQLYPDEPSQVDEQLVRTIINQEKPAFCTYELYIQEPPVVLSQ